MYVTYTLHEHFDVLEKDFHRLFLEFQISPEGETVHQLRVNMKKQMAFFQMLRALETHLPLEEIQAPFAAFFKSIGKIRNLEIRQTILSAEEREQKIKSEYVEALTHNIQEEKDWWLSDDVDISLIPIRLATDKVRSSIDRMPLCNIREMLGEYFYFLIEEIRQIIQNETPSAEQLHDLRKILKVCYLNLKLTDRLIPQASLSKSFYLTLNELNELLGLWHDQFISVYKVNAKKDKIDKQVVNSLRRKERIARKKIVKAFPTIYDLTTELQKALFHLFAQAEPVKIPPRRFQERKYKTIRNSFSQINTLEFTK